MNTNDQVALHRLHEIRKMIVAVHANPIIVSRLFGVPCLPRLRTKMEKILAKVALDGIDMQIKALEA
jgi:hypothetical protein